MKIASSKPRALLLGVLVVTGVGALLAADKTFSDPAPPETHEPAEGPAPEAEKYPSTTFHRAPKPLPEGAKTEDWPRFLGPRRNLVSAETKLLAAFPAEGPPLVWEAATGRGYSSPSIVGDRLVYLHRVGNQERVECLQPETGRRYWSFAYATKYRDRYGYGDGPRASPIIDGDRVYTYGAQGMLHCLRLRDGAELWRRNITEEFKVPQDFFGSAATPLIEGDRLVLGVGAPGGPTVAAFNKNSGEMLWGAGEEWGPSYASAVAADVAGRRRVLVFAGGESRPPTGGLLSINPRNGAVDFAFPWRSRTYESVNAATPVVVDDDVLISATYRTGAAMLRLLPDGGYRELWTSSDFDLHWTTPIHDDGYFYGFAGRNEPDASLMCINAKTGETVWSEVLEWEEEATIGGRLRTIPASPGRGFLMQVDGRFLALGEHGHLLWLQLSPEGPRILSRARLFLARQTWSPPVISRGLLYVSQNTNAFDSGAKPRLLCYDLRAD